MSFDLAVFNLIHGLAGKWEWMDFLGIFFAKYFEYFLLALLLVFLAFNFKKHWRMVLEAVVAAGISRFVLAELIRFIWFRPRPFVALNFLPLINKSANEASFPSGHASFYFALSTIVYFYNKKAGIAFYTASFLIVISRIYTGVHWPLDIIAGAALGIIVAWIAHKFFKKFNWEKYENYIFRGGRGI